ncbi:hypothetical protein K456DRAFT_52419 [Colletotrichum gloeosporioides 23]|nr:hypothetical protein K456DRAFT_52419 [Colletotrichum gloeosporioides 23]
MPSSTSLMDSSCTNESPTHWATFHDPSPTLSSGKEPFADHARRITGTAIAWKFRNQSKGEFLSGNRTQTGQKSPHVLATALANLHLRRHFFTLLACLASLDTTRLTSSSPQPSPWPSTSSPLVSEEDARALLRPETFS